MARPIGGVPRMQQPINQPYKPRRGQHNGKAVVGPQTGGGDQRIPCREAVEAAWLRARPLRIQQRQQ